MSLILRTFVILDFSIATMDRQLLSYVLIFTAELQYVRLTSEYSGKIEMKSVWSDELYNRLIDLWRDKECFYAVSSGFYRDRDIFYTNL